jgi:hypothetical protein
MAIGRVSKLNAKTTARTGHLRLLRTRCLTPTISPRSCRQPKLGAQHYVRATAEAGAERSGMFAFADRDHVTEVVTAAGWAPRFEKLDMDLDIAAGRGLREAVVQSTQIGAVNSWLRKPASRGRLGRHRLC